MGYISIILIGVALAMDAFAVSLSRGIGFKEFDSNATLKMGITFGLFQAIMIVIGWFVGGYFSTYIERYNKVIVFIVFVGLGVKLLIDAIKGNDEGDEKKSLNFKTLMALGFATSLDALAVGVTFVTYKGADFIPPVLIGMVTFIITVLGAVLGYGVGKKVESKIGEIIGAIILIVLGLRVLF
ncbi:MAG: manganese efflux pump MntP family protein [Clostridium sp.]|uniref:manganese efflux pump MntP n=1 Tax=Clostridium sp. TaxID=1506 RepID=UPI003EE5E4D6